jgi:hypothetical protein
MNVQSACTLNILYILILSSHQRLLFPMCSFLAFQTTYFASVLCMLNASNNLIYRFDYSDISWRVQINGSLFLHFFCTSSPKIQCKVLCGRSPSRSCLRHSLFAHSALYFYVSVTLQRNASWPALAR